MRRDPLTQGPRLFAANCASCHSVKREEEGTSVLCAKPTAPNLGEFASRAWLRGLLDPAKIVSPDYFGAAGDLKEGEMVNWVNDNVPDMDDETRAKLDKVLIALSAEAQLPSQREADAKDAAIIEEGRTLFSEVGCADCHKFHDEGETGLAPDLTGYGSRAWLMGMISNPNHDRFYAHLGDAQLMPAFAPSAENKDVNQLTQDEIGLIADWLRGDWYRAPASADAN
jgi:ubiquinol-cytochrome c reductase cytochrome b subunit